MPLKVRPITSSSLAPFSAIARTKSGKTCAGAGVGRHPLDDREPDGADLLGAGLAAHRLGRLRDPALLGQVVGGPAEPLDVEAPRVDARGEVGAQAPAQPRRHLARGLHLADRQVLGQDARQAPVGARGVGVGGPLLRAGRPPRRLRRLVSAAERVERGDVGGLDVQVRQAHVGRLQLLLLDRPGELDEAGPVVEDVEADLLHRVGAPWVPTSARTCLAIGSSAFSGGRGAGLGHDADEHEGLAREQLGRELGVPLLPALQRLGLDGLVALLGRELGQLGAADFLRTTRRRRRASPWGRPPGRSSPPP